MGIRFPASLVTVALVALIATQTIAAATQFAVPAFSQRWQQDEARTAFPNFIRPRVERALRRRDHESKDKRGERCDQPDGHIHDLTRIVLDMVGWQDAAQIDANERATHHAQANDQRNRKFGHGRLSVNPFDQSSHRREAGANRGVDAPLENMNSSRSSNGKEVAQRLRRLLGSFFRKEVSTVDRSATHVMCPCLPKRERAALIGVPSIETTF